MNSEPLLNLRKRLAGLIRYIRIFGPSGAYFALYCLFSKRQKLARVSRRWSKSPIYVRLNTSDVTVFCQVFLEQEYRITKHIPNELESILDAGANIGLTAIFLAQLYPSSTIFSLEPEIENLELLKLNTQPLKNVRVIHGALWNRDESLEIQSPDAESWAFRVQTRTGASGSSQVQGYRLGTLIAELGLERLSLLKIDIEGAEFEVFGDHGDWVDRVDNIVAEIHERIQPGCNQRFAEATRAFPHSTSRGELILVSREELELNSGTPL